jgi:hypothetical protein
MSHSLRLGVIASSTGFLAAAGDASAAVLFEDRFENVTDNALPSPTVGTWDADDSNGRVVSGGTSTATRTYPAASPTGGAKFLRVDQAEAGARNAGILSSPASGIGTAFHMQVEFYASTANTGLGFSFGSEVAGESGGSTGLSSTASGAAPRPRESFRVSLVYTGGVGQVRYFKDADGAGTGANLLTNSGLTFVPNTFTKFEVDYNLGDTTLQLSATPAATTANPDPVTATVTLAQPFFSSTATTPVTSLSQVNTVFVQTISTGAISYADNLIATGSVATAGVPEPTALGGVLGMAGLLALRRSRKAHA